MSGENGRNTRQPVTPVSDVTIHGRTPPDEGDIALPTDDPERRPPPGQAGIVMLGLAVGILLIGMQLWLLTLAFDLYLAGETGDTLFVAFWSGLVFLGGLIMLRILGRGPRRTR